MTLENNPQLLTDIVEMITCTERVKSSLDEMMAFGTSQLNLHQRFALDTAHFYADAVRNDLAYTAVNLGIDETILVSTLRAQWPNHIETVTLNPVDEETLRRRQLLTTWVRENSPAYSCASEGEGVGQ